MANNDEQWRDWVQELKTFQESDRDQREQANESDYFLLEKDGQWESRIAEELDSQKRPRYTFDKITPVIETMMADIEDMDFAGNVKPAGGESNKATALTLDGMIRGIQNHSNTEYLYRQACRRLIRRGFDAWVVKAKYMDEWSFEQDLVVESIPNAVNRVWASNTSTVPDSSDSPVAYVLSSMSKDDYKEQFPKGTGVSVDDNSGTLNNLNDDYQSEVITIAERYYQEESPIEVAQLNNGDVVELNEKWEMIKDEKRLQGIVIALNGKGEPKIKKVKGFKWYHCTFDGGGILTEKRLTVFKTNPVVTVYGNYELLGQSSKITYSGVTLKEMDAQRVHNYAKSREIEEGALAPRAKWWMTKKQAKGNERQLSKMNTSADPVQFFTPDPEMPGYPQYSGGPQINPHLSTLGNQMAMDIKEQANVFDAMQGQFAGRQSEDAIRMQIDRGTGATRKWVNALVFGIQRTCDILLQAIPEVYDTTRQFAIVGVNGEEDMVVLNEEVLDRQTNRMVQTNNLNAGKYKVTVDAGPAFANRMEAGLSALTEYAALDPSIIQTGGDVMLRAIDAPMVDQIADRKRLQMISAGLIPEDQMTEEEIEKLQKLRETPQEPDAAMVLAQAEMAKAQADQTKADNDTIRLNLEMAKVQQSGQKVSIEEAMAISKIQNTNADTVKKLADAEQTSEETQDSRMKSLIDQLDTADILAAIQ